jgi:restriction endonuclease S subunit
MFIIPPLPAQEKIVEKLNLLATKYKQSKEGMTVKIAKLKQLKASILDTAFRGQL